MAANLFERLLPMAKAAGPRLRAALPTLGGLALLLVAATWTYDAFFDETPETYGQLVVDSPEIYTRERLVNDRFVEDAWLRRKLRASDTADFKPTASAARRSANSMRLAWSGAEAGGEADAPVSPRDIARRDAIALFRSELTYRSDIRNLIIENQLDDRHDLRGNSLYRLKFDASVLPGDNTRANALISVTLEEPPHQRLDPKDIFFTAFSPEDLKRWRGLFSDWINDIALNVNQAVIDLKHDYNSNRFPREYLIDLFMTMQGCEGYDHSFYNSNIKLRVENEDVDLKEIRAHIEPMREDLTNCSESTVETRGIPSDARVAVDSAKRVPPAPTSIAADGTVDNVDLNEENKTAELEHITIKPRRKFDLGATKSVAFNEIINRFAAPRIFQLAFGRGNSIGKAPGRVGSWDFFEPYANLLVFYTYDENAFQISEIETILTAAPTASEADSPCDGEGVFIPWDQASSGFWQSQDQGFCLAVAGLKFDPAELENFLRTMDISRKDIPEIFSGNQELKENLTTMIERQGKPVSIVVESGLFSFIRDLQQSSSVFSYAVTPKQAVQALVVDEQTDRSAAVAASANGVGGQMGGESSVGFSGVREQPLVVGFGNALGGDHSEIQGGAQIEFGWFISPPVQGTDNKGLHRAHAAAQYALTALVSVPAWWDVIDLKVERAWLNHDGKKIAAPEESGPPKDAVVSIDLPRDLESISSLLLDRSAGPEIEEGKMEPIAVTACRPAAVLLPGRRLWRSAVVTLGSQPADEIHVLPNMRGIIAKFDRIDMPSGWTNTQVPHKAPVTVWTSEGSRTLRKRAQIRLPSTYGDTEEAVASILYPNGTCKPEPTGEGAGEQQAKLK